MESVLGNYRLYQRQIERLHTKHLLTPLIYDLQQDGVSLATMILNSKKVAKLLAKTVERGDYEFGPAKVRVIRTERKLREVYSYRLTDLIIHGAVADVIHEAMNSSLSPRLFSYRGGVSCWNAISHFCSFIRANRKSSAQPQRRGVYVARRDVEEYADSIPVGQSSRVWEMLRHVLESSTSTAGILSSHWHLIENIVRPEVLSENGALLSRIHGVPTGQPISCVLFNLYLSELDKELEGIPAAFYARYSDDILFAVANPDTVKEVGSRIEKILSGLGLRLNPEKSQDFYLTAAGRPSTEWSQTRGTNSVPYLGACVWADGTFSLDRRKTRRLLRGIENRAFRAARTIGDGDLDSTGRIVCSIINRALDPKNSFFQPKSASLLLRAVNNRSYLATLDYQIARSVLRAVTGERHVSAFRRVEYRRIRRDWGLVSLLHSRNKWEPTIS